MTFSDRYNTLSSSLFLEACNGHSVERTPVWFMRQAGRILPKYRQIRKRYNSIQTLFKTPELAAEITIMPIKELGVDAAILYTDLVTPLEPLGCPYHYSPGPVFEKSLNNRKDILDLKIVDCESDLAFIEKTIKITINSLPIDIPLIGYSGSPFTLASWLVEGQSSKDFPAIRKLIYSDP